MSPFSDFSPNDLSRIIGFELSGEQVEIVTSQWSTPLQVVAGAGSGKTSVMAARVVFAVANGFVRPEQVVGLTFTSKAAAELSARLRLWLGRLDEFNESDGESISEPLICTYHSFAHQLINEYGLRAGIEPASRLLSDADSTHLALQVVERTDVALSGFGVGPAALAPAVVALDHELAEHAADLSSLRTFDERLLRNISELDKSVARDRAVRETSRKRLQLCSLVEEFRAEKLRRGVVDFADLMRFGLAVSQDEDVAAQVRARWSFVLLDEYQDTSVVQARLLSELFHDHAVTAVGDPLQAIYGWRGASASAMDEFGSLFTDSTKLRKRELSISHRSGARILAAANRVADPLRSLQSSVILRCPDAAGVRADDVRTALLETYAHEVEFVADSVGDQIRAGISPSSIAVICRQNKDFSEIASALASRGVACAVSAVEGLLVQPEVVDLVSTLQVMHDPAANPAALRLLLGPRWRIGPRDLAVARATGSRAWPGRSRRAS